MAGRDFGARPRHKDSVKEQCLDIECMDQIAPFINGCATVAHSGSLEGVDVSGFEEGDLIWNSDGLSGMEQWDGCRPAPLDFGFIGMTVTLDDGCKVKVTSRDDKDCLIWTKMPPPAFASDVTPKAILNSFIAALNDPDCESESAQLMQIICDNLPSKMTEV